MSGNKILYDPPDENFGICQPVSVNSLGSTESAHKLMESNIGLALTPH